MRKITKFPKLVINEAKNLKKLATPEELANLNIEKLDTDSRIRCVYGQMTSDCNSERAIQLIENCTKRVYHAPNLGSPKNSNKLNGSPKKMKRKSGNYSHEIYYFSPIEVFIDRAPKEMNAKLIAFLKGERKRLI